MLCAEPMTAWWVHRVIRYNKKSIHLSVFSSKKQMLFTELRQASSTRFFYDALCLDVFIQAYSGSA